MNEPNLSRCAIADEQKALKSYAADVQAMMTLPVTNSRNWFRTRLGPG